MTSPNTSGFVPVGNRVLVKPVIVEEATPSGIVIAKSLTDKEKNAQIIAELIDMGTEAWADSPEPWAKLGDTVVYGKFHGLYWKGSDGSEYRILDDIDVIGIVTDDARLASEKNVAPRSAGALTPKQEN